MSHGPLLQLAGILVLGVLAQWGAWWLRLPSILLLLTAGILAGPVTGWLHPDTLLGDLLLPAVSLSVAVILYEGGLNLKLRELRNIGGPFLLLTTVGAVVSWIIGAAAAHYVLEFAWPVATLLGAILVVTGPTVIGPILRHLRMRGNVAAILKWEGIIIDPAGAMLAVLVYTAIQAGAFHQAVNEATVDLCMTVVVGSVAGCLGAGFLILVLSRFWVPDSLHNPVSLMLVFLAFTSANALQDESGLFAVTLMGIILANQKWTSIHHVVEFKETLGILLISGLFIVLSARLDPDHLRGLNWRSLAFVAVLIVAARPLSVLASTWGSALTWQERSFLCCMAPRGIVAAAISSVFALNLTEAGYQQAAEIVPVTFLVVFVTVLVYGLMAGPLGRRLGLVQTNPQGILFVGAHPWVRALAGALREEGYSVFLVDTDSENVRDSRMAGLPCLYGSALAEATRDRIDYAGLGRMLAVTANNEVNSLACLRYAEDFGRQEVYQLSFSPSEEGRHEAVSREHRGRFLFGDNLTFSALSDFAGADPKVKKTGLTQEFNYEAFRAEHGNAVVPLVVLKADDSIQIQTQDERKIPEPGDFIISIVRGSVPEPLPAAAPTA